MCGADIACVLTDHQLVRVRLSDATVERRLPLPRDTVDPQHPETVERLVGSPDGKTLAIVAPDGGLRILNARTGRVVANSRAHPVTCTRWRSHRTGAGSSPETTRAC